MPTRKIKFNWIALYLIGALIALASLNIFFAISGMSFTWGFDGYSQHYTAAVYAKTFWTSILSGQGIPMYEFAIGEGTDGIISTLYYGLTEPWSILYVFVPQHAILSVFEAFLMIRLLLSGLFFGLYARKYSDNHYAIATAALCYTFSGWFMFWIQAPNLLTAGMLFPLLLYSMDIAFDKKKYTPLLLITALMYISNYYMGMTTSFILLAYALLRIVMSKQWNKEAFLQYFKTAGAHLLGILTSCAILIPVVLGIISSPRLNGGAGYTDSLLVYNFQYYVKLLCQFAVPNIDANIYWGTLAYQTHLNFFPIAAIATVLFIQTKTEPGSHARRLKWCLLLCAVFACVPFFGKLFNAWSYPTQRWGVALSMVISLIVLWYIPRMKTAKPNTYLISIIWIWCGICVNYYIADARAAYTSIAVTAIVTACTFIKLTDVKAYIATILAAVLFFFSSFIAYPYAQEFNTNRFYTRDFPYHAVQLTQEEYDEMTRVANDSGTLNANNGLLIGFSTTSQAWNVSHSTWMYYNNNMQALPTAHGDWVFGINYRPAIATLAGVKYYPIIATDTNKAPLGFKESYRTKVYGFASEFAVFENKYNPGIGYMMQGVMSMDEFQKLDIAAKQIALMKYAIVNTENHTQTVPSISIPYTMEKTDTSYIITFDAVPGYDLYLSFDNATQHGSGKIQVATYETIKQTISSMADEDITGSFVVITEDTYGHKVEQDALLFHDESIQPVGVSYKTLHLGTIFNGKTTITLNAPQVCIEPTDFAIYGYHEDDYYTAAEYLCNNNLQNVHAIDGAHPEITGDIDVKQDGIMQLAIPYSDGWSVYVDGEQVDTFVCGGKYIGIELTAGHHDIQMKYRTPGIIPGLIISAIASILACVWLVYEWRQKLQWLLTESKHSTACRFLIAGGCTTALDFLIYLALLGISVPTPLAKFCSITISAIISFVINKYWSFKRQHGSIAKQGIKFAITQGANILVNVTTNSLLLSLCNVTIVAFIGATLCGMIVNFALQKFWVFQTKEES